MSAMKISVWDTYVAREDGKTMHFDILVPHNLKDKNIIFDYGREFLSTKSFKTNGLSTKACTYCHMEMASDTISEAINRMGYFILEMENCE